MACTVVFIDADNQPPALAAPLAKFLASMGRDVGRIIVAGNSSGDRVRGWEQALLTALPGTEVQCHVAPLRKQSADVRLMFELAPFYHRDPDPATLILVLSRDDLLLAATECLVAKGHNAMIAVGGGANGTPIVADLPIVVLPSPQPAATSTPPSPVAALSNAPINAATTGTAVTIDQQTVSAAVTKIRQSIAPNKQGGYEASAVGQVLAKLGHDKAMREKIVKAIPNRTTLAERTAEPAVCRSHCPLRKSLGQRNLDRLNLQREEIVQ